MRLVPGPGFEMGFANIHGYLDCGPGWGTLWKQFPARVLLVGCIFDFFYDDTHYLPV